MDRRTVIKNLALIIGGTALLPACVRHDGTVYYQLKHITIDGDQQSLIADICETIIPKTNTPGAKDLNLPAFVLKMLDDCYKKEDQQTFLVGLGQFNNLVKKKYDRAFADLSTKEKEACLTELEKNTNPKAHKPVPKEKFPKPQEQIPKPQKKHDTIPLNAFYWTIKQQTLFGYNTSQYFMTKQVVYELVPGRYNAHFPVKKTNAA